MASIVEVDLLIEQAGQQVAITGSGDRLLARFFTFRSLVHFAWAGWFLRRQIPAGIAVSAAWRKFQIRVR